MSLQYSNKGQLLKAHTNFPHPLLAMSNVSYVKIPVKSTDIEGIFIDVLGVIKEFHKSLSTVKWNVYIRFSAESKISSDTMAEILNVLVSGGQFKFFGNMPPVQPYILFFDKKFKYDQKCRISIIKGSLNSDNQKWFTDKGVDVVSKNYATASGNNNPYTFIISKKPIINIVENIDISPPNVPVMLTRSGVFPPGPPLYRISFTSQAVYSATQFDINQAMVQDILDYNIPNIMMLDGTANVGTDVIGSIVGFGEKIRMIAIEIDPINYSALVKNIHLYNMDKYVYTIHGDTVKEIMNPLVDKNQITLVNVMYFDPPWGGREYKEKKTVDLFLGDKNIFDLVGFLGNNPGKYPNLQLIVIKAPYNFNRQGLEDFGASVKVIEHGTNYHKICYVYIDVTYYRNNSNYSEKISSDISPPSLEEFSDELFAPKELRKRLCLA